MRIAVWHNLPSGGGKRALYDYVRGLVKRGHEVESWCLSTADQSYLPLNQIIKEHVIPLSWPSKKRPGLPGFLKNYLTAIDKIEAIKLQCQKCAEEINQGGFDLLFAHPCMFYAAPFIGRYVSIPKVLYLQEPHRRLYEALPRLPWVALEPSNQAAWSFNQSHRFLWDLSEVQALRVQAREELHNAQAFDLILVNSYFSRESLLRAYNLDSEVCYLGVDLNRFQNQHQPQENFVIGVGSFTPAKNIKFVIESLAQVERSRPALVWVGNFVDSGYLEELQQLAKRLQVNFTPKIRISDQELIDLLNRALLTIYTPRLEPFGYGSIEANACGLPVVSIAEGGLRETVIDGFNGLIAENNPRAIAASVQKLVDNPDYARQLGQNGYQYVNEHWTVEAAVDRLEKKLIKLLP
jgi:glycosyltransferase involved in cell wall biosynthesis